MVKVQGHALEDSLYPKDLAAAWARGMCAQGVEQKVAPMVEGVQEKLVGEESKEDVE